jgi:hypothetical protein
MRPTGAVAAAGMRSFGEFSAPLTVNERMPKGFSMEDSNDLYENHDDEPNEIQTTNRSQQRILHLTTNYAPSYDQHLPLHASLNQTRSTIFYSSAKWESSTVMHRCTRTLHSSNSF